LGGGGGGAAAADAPPLPRGHGRALAGGLFCAAVLSAAASWPCGTSMNSAVCFACLLLGLDWKNQLIRRK